MSAAMSAPLVRRIDRAERARLTRYVLVGISNTVVAIVLYAIGIELGLWYPLAAAVAYVAAIANGYTWHRIWTFETGPFHLPEFLRFVLVHAAGLVANVLGLAFAVGILGMGEFTGELATLPVIVLATFIAARYWAFRPRPASES